MLVAAMMLNGVEGAPQLFPPAGEHHQHGQVAFALQCVRDGDLAAQPGPNAPTV
jgi:hypothetical protein